jgi:hypothetical protein
VRTGEERVRVVKPRRVVRSVNFIVVVEKDSGLVWFVSGRKTCSERSKQ